MKRLVLGSILLATVFSMLLTPGLVRADGDGADDSNHATLLVKVPAEKVGDIAALAKKLGGQAIDLETLLPVAVPGATPAKAVPHLGDVTSIVRAALAAAAESSGDIPVVLQKLAVRRRNARVTVTVITPGPDAADRFRNALVSQTTATGNWVVLSVDAGSVQVLKSGHQRASFDMRLEIGPMPSQPMPPIDDPRNQPGFTRAVDAAAKAAGLEMIFASAQKADPDREANVVEHARDFTFNACDIEQLQEFLKQLEQAEDLTVTEIRFGAADEKQQEAGRPLMLQKPAIKVSTLRRIK